MPHDPSDAEPQAPRTRLRRPFAETLLGDYVLVIHQSTIKPLGGIEAAALFAQLAYWHNRAKDRGDLWAYRTQEQLERETGLSEKSQKTIRKHLIELGVLIEKRRGIPAKLYYQTVIERLEALVEKTWDETPDPPEGGENGGDSSISPGENQVSPEGRIKHLPRGESSISSGENQDSPRGRIKTSPEGESLNSVGIDSVVSNETYGRAPENLAADPPEEAPPAAPEETPPAPSKPMKPLPLHTPAHRLIAAFCGLAGIDQPSNYGRALGNAKTLIKHGVTEENLPSLYAMADWGDGPDFAKMIGSLDRWKIAQAKPRLLSPHLQRRVDAWKAERVARNLPLGELPPTLQADLEAWDAAVREVESWGLPKPLHERAMRLLTERSARVPGQEPRPYLPLPEQLQAQVNDWTARARTMIGGAR